MMTWRQNLRLLGGLGGTILMLLHASVSVAQSLIVDDGRRLLLAPVEAPPLIDGRLDEWPLEFDFVLDDPTQLSRNDGEQTRWLGPRDGSVHLYVRYDAYNLFVAGQVLDDDIVVNESTWWDGDAIEVFVDSDLEGDRDSTSYNDDDFQVFLMPWSPMRSWGVAKSDGGATVSHGGFDGVEVAWSEQSGLTFFEAAIPLANFPGLEKGGGSIGFNLAFNDVDTEDHPGFGPSYLTLNGAEKLYLNPSAFIETELVDFEEQRIPHQGFRLWNWIWRSFLALALISSLVGVGLYLRSFHDRLERVLPRWRLMGVLVVAVAAILVFGIPLLVDWRLSGEADEALSDGFLVVDRLAMILEDQGFVANWPGLSEPRVLLDFLNGLVVNPPSRYHYRIVDFQNEIQVPPGQQDRVTQSGLREEVESQNGIPFQLAPWSMPSGGEWRIALPRPTVCEKVHVAIQATSPKTIRRGDRRDSSIVRVSFLHRSGLMTERHVSVPLGISDKRPQRPDEDFLVYGDQPLPCFAFEVDADLNDPLERLLVHALDPETPTTVYGVTFESEGTKVPLRHGPLAQNGTPAGILSSHEGILLAPDSRVRLPMSDSPDSVWLFYSLEQDALAARKLDGEEGLRVSFWYENDPDPHDTSLRIGQHIDTSDRYFSELGQTLESELAFDWGGPVESMRLDPMRGRKLESLELYCPSTLSGMRIHSLVSARQVQVELNTEQELIRIDQTGESLFLDREVEETLSEFQFVVIESGEIQATNFEADLDQRLGGVFLGQEPSFGRQRFGDRDYVYADRPLLWDGKDSQLRILREIDGEADIPVLRKRLGAIALILCLPLSVLLLLDRVRRLPRLRLKFTSLLIFASVGPILVLSLLTHHMMGSEQDRSIQARAFRLLRNVQSSVEQRQVRARSLAHRVLEQSWVRSLVDQDAIEQSTLIDELERQLEGLARQSERMAIRLDVTREEETQTYRGHLSGSFEVRPDFGYRGLLYNWGRLLYASTAEREEAGFKFRVTVNGLLDRDILGQIGLRSEESAALFSIDRKYRQRHIEGGVLISDTEFGTEPPSRGGLRQVIRSLRTGAGPQVRARDDGGIEAYDFLRDRDGQPVALFGVTVAEDRPSVDFGFGAIPLEWLFLALGGFMLSLSLVLGSFLSDDIITPIKRLVRAAKAISRGRAFPEPISQLHDDEIGSLTHAYNNMSNELARRRDEQERLRMVQLELSQTLELDDQLRLIMRILGRELRPRSLSLLLYDRDRDRLVEYDLNKGGEKKVFVRAQSEGLFSMLGATDMAVFRRGDIETSSWSQAEREFLKSSGPLGFVPLGAKGLEAGIAVARFDPGRDPLESLSLDHLASLRELLAAALRHARLYQLAIEDPTTGLVIPTYFRSRLSEELDRSSAEDRNVILFKLGIESFDSIHEATDSNFASNLELAIARKIRAACRSIDVISREGPGVFCILLPEGGAPRMEPIWRAVTRDLPSYRSSKGKAVPVRLIGASVSFPEDGRSREFLTSALERKWLTAGASEPKWSGNPESRSALGQIQERFADFVLTSPRMEEVLDQARRVAVSKATVMILGETGTGKEVMARIIHDLSDRADGPFVALNCSALPETLLESELFGHEKGAFTGADRSHSGHFEEAVGGTLFLDEVGELTLETQAKLLRVLQERKIQRLGGRRPIDVDVRILTATNRNLEEMVRNGSFREDLYYRLKVVTITIPPLRERLDDLPKMAELFVRKQCEEVGLSAKTLEPSGLDKLFHHGWPGNVRELRNVIQRAVLLSEGEAIGPGNIDLLAVSRSNPAQNGRPGGASSTDSIHLRTESIVDLNDRQRRLLELLQEKGSLTNRDYFEEVGVSRRTGLRDIAVLIDRGLILKQGHRRAAHYRLAN